MRVAECHTENVLENSIEGLTDAWKSQWLPILELARFAPSGDNCQPWEIEQGPTASQSILHLTTSQPPAFLDVNGEASRIAFGSFCESIRIAASNFKLKANQRRSFVDTSSLLSVEVELENEHCPADPLSEYLEARVSNRKPQRPESVSMECLSELESSVLHHSQASVKFTGDRAEIAKIAAATAMADGVRFRHRQCHEEFHSKVRWSKADEIETGTGFSPDTFEISFFERLALRATRPWRVLQFADKVGRMGSMVTRYTADQVKKSSNIGWLSSNLTGEQGWVDVGNALQRVWLTATKLNLGFQVLAVAPILCRRATLFPNDFSRQELRTLNDSKLMLQSVCGSVVHSSDNQSTPEVAIMFRVGHADAPSDRTCRRSAIDLIKR